MQCFSGLMLNGFIVISKLAPLCLMWILWKEGNYCTFKDVEVSDMQLKTYFLRLLSEWLTVLGLSDSGTIIKFTESLSLVAIL
jgi:hypothetical protein